ncbi:hypothetical protein ACHAWF_017576 [Thalassiosira exigua]
MNSTLLVLASILGALRVVEALEHSHASCVSDHCIVQLSPDLLLRYRLLPPEGSDALDGCGDCDTDDCKCKIYVQMRYHGLAWLGLGVSSEGKMVGSRAVIGQPGISDPATYYLGGKDVSSVKVRGEHHLDGASIEFVDDLTVMEFTTKFSNFVSRGQPAGIGLGGPSTFIWAHGNDGETDLNYHGPGNKAFYKIENLMGAAPETQSANSMSTEETISATRALWVAHGVMAFLAYGICMPVAITAAILRDCIVPDVLKGFVNKISQRWMYIHVGLNTLTYILTLAVFSVAVSTINIEKSSHWEHGHSKMGLAIFMLVSCQVIGGYFRPSAASDRGGGENGQEENGEGGIRNEDSIGDFNPKHMKSTMRQIWELLHHLFGIALFFFGVWQMYKGIELYRQRYSKSVSQPRFYVLWMALCIIVIMGGTLYKWLFQKRSLDGDDVEMKEQASTPNDESEKNRPQDSVVDDARGLT